MEMEKKKVATAAHTGLLRCIPFASVFLPKSARACVCSIVRPAPAPQLPVELKEIATADTYNLCVASALLTHAVLRGAAAAVDAEAEGAQAQAQQGSAGRRSMLEALSEEEQRWALLAAFLLPLRSTQAKKGKGKATAASAHVVRPVARLVWL